MRDTLGLLPSYPDEEDSTTIYRLMDADLIEELAGAEIRDPQSLPNSGAPVYMATDDEIVRMLGLLQEEGEDLYIGETVGGANVRIVLKRQAIQRHMFICGTTGSRKSYAMGVIAEELTAQGLPMVFIDTQDEYSTLVEKLGGKVVQPGTDFTIRVSPLTESELLDLLPAATTELQRDIVARAFSELQQELVSDNIAKFGIDQLTARIERVGPLLTTRPDSVSMALSRTASLKRNPIFGMGMDKADWRKIMHPCMAINCKRLTTTQLQPIATAVLRELQTLRLHDHIPPYVVVLDEAHLFVPDREANACKRIIREGVRIGRHHGICMVLMTQSPADIDKRAIRQCNTRLVFALEPDQLGAIRGVKSDASEEMLRALPKMPRGTCLLSGTYESVKHTIPVRIRLRTTQDSEGGETPDIFAEMRETWQPHIEALKRDQQ